MKESVTHLWRGVENICTFLPYVTWDVFFALHFLNIQHLSHFLPPREDRKSHFSKGGLHMHGNEWTKNVYAPGIMWRSINDPRSGLFCNRLASTKLIFYIIRFFCIDKKDHSSSDYLLIHHNWQKQNTVTNSHSPSLNSFEGYIFPFFIHSTFILLNTRRLGTRSLLTQSLLQVTTSP